jgi:hypothetical protein
MSSHLAIQKKLKVEDPKRVFKNLIHVVTEEPKIAPKRSFICEIEDSVLMGKEADSTAASSH